MVGYKLTLEQKESIQGVFYNSECFFECVKVLNNYRLKSAIEDYFNRK